MGGLIPFFGIRPLRADLIHFMGLARAGTGWEWACFEVEWFGVSAVFAVWLRPVSVDRMAA